VVASPIALFLAQRLQNIGHKPNAGKQRTRSFTRLDGAKRLSPYWRFAFFIYAPYLPMRIPALTKSKATSSMLPMATTPSKRKRAAKPGGYAAAHVVGAITGDGNFVSLRALTEAGLHILPKDGRPTLRFKADAASGEDTDSLLQHSHEIRDDADMFNYSRDNVIEPPWPFPVLAMLQTTNTIHGAAIDTKAADYSYNEYRLEPTEWAKTNLSEDTLDAARAECGRFLETCYDGQPIEELLRDVALDFETFGSAGFEIRRNRKGFIGACNQIPFLTVRVLRDAFAEETGARYLQRRFSKKAYFVDLGDNTTIVGADGLPLDLDIATEEEFPDYDARDQRARLNETFVGAYDAEEVADFDDAASEFYFITRPPYTRSSTYGTPAGITAYGAMLAQLKIDQYNLAFFGSKGVPQYAVIFEGLALPSGGEGQAEGAAADAKGDITMQPSESAALQQTIEMFFRKHLASAERSVLVLTTYGDAKVRFQKLSTDKLEASFSEYETRNRETIRMAHRVPGPALGIYETANLGGGRDTAAMIRYRDHIVAPGQRMLEKIVNRLLRFGLFIPYFGFKFSALNVEEEQARRAFALQEFMNGGITLDEYRLITGRAAVPDGRGNVFVYRTPPTMINADPEQLQQQLSAMAAREMRFRKLLSGAAVLEDLDDAD